MDFDAKHFYVMSTETIDRRKALSEHKLTHDEVQFLQESLSADYVNGNIRLREGEYQYDLAKTIAAFQLELRFPDVKDIIRRLYGEEKTNDIQFIRKVQTILKKMEKSNIIKILPKKKPWELQRYTLSSFKFRDSDKNLVSFADGKQIEETQNILRSILNQKGISLLKVENLRTRLYTLVLALVIVASYGVIVWNIFQSIINPILFIPAFSIAVVSSIMLGRILARE